jgi:D-3-phosphoglycerate dehydrogenase
VKVLVTDYDFPDLDFELKLFQANGVEAITAQCRSEDEVIAAAADCDALLVQYAPITHKVLAALPRVGIASRFGAGYDTVDPEACRAHGVWLANSPDYGIGEVATHALALALSLVRGLPGYDREVRAGRWSYLSAGVLRRPAELTLGLLGLGRIGKRMAHVSRNVFGRVLACDPYLIDGDFPAYVERATLDALFDRSDVVSLHVPLNPETRAMVNARLLRRMKRGSFLVNTARGAVCDLDAVLAALDEGILAGAGLDVLPAEPPPEDHAILAHPRIVLSPHAAFFSDTAERELRRKAAQNIVTWWKTGRPEYVVVPGTRQYIEAVTGNRD